MKTHKLKIKTHFWREIFFCRKNAEIIKNDRVYKVGDFLIFTPIYDKKNKIKTDIQLRRKISHIVEGGQFGVEQGYVMVSLALPFV